MIEITNTEVVGWEHAIRGMRNPLNSWDKSDSCDCFNVKGGCGHFCDDCFEPHYVVGKNDLELMKKLSKNGPVHSKYLRMITVYFDVNAPLYWWKEMDTYKVATVRNSCSTMHKIQAKEFTFEDFSCEHLDLMSTRALRVAINNLNRNRDLFLQTTDKQYWWNMIQVLPSSYNQKSTMMMNYETLKGLYKWRKNHKLDEWKEFCKWVESLPYSELITEE